MTCGEEQNSIFSQSANKHQISESIFFGMRKHNSDESIFMKNLNRMMDNYKMQKDATLKPETQVNESVIVDPLGAYLANSPSVTDPLSPNNYTTPVKVATSDKISNSFLSNEDRQKELSEIRKKLTEYTPFENYKDSESISNNKIEPKVEIDFKKSEINYDEDEDDDDEDSDEDDSDEDYDDEDEEEDESFDKDNSSNNRSGISFTTPKIIGSLFKSVTNSIKTSSKIETVTKKFSDITTSIQSKYNDLPINSSDVFKQIKSLSIHANLKNAFNNTGNNMHNTASFSGKLNSADSVSSLNSFDDFEMPDNYEPDVDIFAKNENLNANSLQDILINIQLTSCNRY